MDPANRSSTSPPFRLLDLPLELQCIIFGYALFTKTTLRRPTEAKRYGDVVIFSGTNILRVSSQVKEETLPIFYQVNHFHYEQVKEDFHHGHPIDVQDIPFDFRRSLHMMRHISIDPIQYQPWGRDRNIPSKLPALEDSSWVHLLVHIERAAPDLRTLALHFGPFATKYHHYAESYYSLPPIESGNIDRLVISTLCQLRARLSRLSLVYFGEPTALEEFRSSIAPLEDWTAQTLGSWPVTIGRKLIEYMEKWQDPSHAGLRVRIWDTCRHPGIHAGDQEY